MSVLPNERIIWDFTESKMNLSTVLFATDFSFACDNAWPYAMAIARRYRAKLLLAHVLAPSIYASVPDQLLSTAQQHARAEAESRLEYMRRLHGGTADIDCEVLLRDGQIADVLLQLIVEYRVDLLVTGTRGRRHLKRLLLGSIAEKVFRQAACPVLVVPEKARIALNGMDRIRHIVCPIDFLPGSTAALACAVSLARAHDAQLTILHVDQNTVLKSVRDMARLAAPSLDRMRRLLPAKLDMPSAPRFEVKFGAPARVISRVAAESQADLVIMAVHSAAAAVAHEPERNAYRVILWSHCPVLTIPRLDPSTDKHWAWLNGGQYECEY